MTARKQTTIPIRRVMELAQLTEHHTIHQLLQACLVHDARNAERHIRHTLNAREDCNASMWIGPGLKYLGIKL